MGLFSPNKVAASEALRLNWDSRNLGPNVDMLAMSVASVAPARQSRMNVGFLRRSQMELPGGREWRTDRRDGRQSRDVETPKFLRRGQSRLPGSGQAPHVYSRETGEGYRCG